MKYVCIIDSMVNITTDKHYSLICDITSEVVTKMTTLHFASFKPISIISKDVICLSSTNVDTDKFEN